MGFSFLIVVGAGVSQKLFEVTELCILDWESEEVLWVN